MPWLLIDNSNTRTKFALGDATGLLSWRGVLTTADLTVETLTHLLVEREFSAVMICSVVPAKAAILQKHFAGKLPLHFLSSSSPLGMGIDYPQPSQIGADRLANAAGILTRHGAPAIIIDFGTAVTFDVISAEPAYCGGVIAPGLGAMSGYLTRKTALLPEIELAEPPSAIGKSTVHAMQAGAVIGYRGLVKEIIARICDELPGSPEIIATGGDAALIARGVPEIKSVDPDITLDGLRQVAARVFCDEIDTKKRASHDQSVITHSEMNDSPLAIGIDFGGTTVKIAVVYQSHIIDQAPPIATQDFVGHEPLIDAMVRVVEDLRARHEGILCIGVGMPGFVNFEKGLVYGLTNVPDWESVPLKKILESKIGLPVSVDNDANCMAFAEWRCGAGRGYQNVVFASLGTGVGGAIIANGQMIRGMRHGAGEIGQTSIDYQGRPGHYGNRGALEDYIGNNEITARAREAYTAAGIQKSLDDCSPASLAAAAHHGDPIAFAQWNDTGRMLATALMNCCWLLNPEAIVLGGGVARAGELLFHPFKEHLFAQLSGPFKDGLVILPASFGHEAGTIGAAALAREHLTGVRQRI